MQFVGYLAIGKSFNMVPHKEIPLSLPQGPQNLAD